MDEPQNNSQSPAARPEDDESNLLDIAIVLAKHKKRILGLPLAAAVLMAAFSLTKPNIYTGTTSILPPQKQQSSAAAMLGQLGALTGGAGSALGLKNPNDLYVGMLKSRTVADNLIRRFKLKDRYEKEKNDAVRKALGRVTNIEAGKDGIIVVSVEDKDPQFAADLANGYVDELYHLTQTLAVTEASQRRLFFERQLKQAKDHLADAEIAFKQTQEITGVLELGEQGKAMIEAVGEMRAHIAAKEVQLSAMRTFATEQNPDYQRTQQELGSLRGQLAKMERGGEVGLVPTGKLPELGLENIRKLREVKYYETLFELLAKQYELARVDEGKESSIIQVLDKAVPSDLKVKPKRALMVIVATLVAGFLTLLWVFMKEAHEKARRNPEQAKRLDKFRKLIKWRES